MKIGLLKQNNYLTKWDLQNDWVSYNKCLHKIDKLEEFDNLLKLTLFPWGKKEEIVIETDWSNFFKIFNPGRPKSLYIGFNSYLLNNIKYPFIQWNIEAMTYNVNIPLIKRNNLSLLYKEYKHKSDHVISNLTRLMETPNSLLSDRQFQMLCYCLHNNFSSQESINFLQK